MLSTFIRTVILYLCVVTALRIMGKRQLGELQPSEFVIALMISDLAAIPVESDDIPIMRGIIPVFTLVLIEFIFSIIILKSETFRRILTGVPVYVIKDGKLIEKNLKKLRICIDDIMEQLRLSGYTSIEQIDSAIIETNGQISLIPKESEREIVCSDLNLSPEQTHVPYTIISDGKIRRNNLKKSGISEKWLKQKLLQYNITDYTEVVYLGITDGKKLMLQISEN